MGRWIRIARPTSAYPFLPRDLSSATRSGSGGAASSSSSRSAALACAVRHGREWAERRGVTSGRRSTGLSAMHLMHVVPPPRKSPLTCSRPSRGPHGRFGHPRLAALPLPLSATPGLPGAFISLPGPHGALLSAPLSPNRPKTALRRHCHFRRQFAVGAPWWQPSPP